MKKAEKITLGIGGVGLVIAIIALFPGFCGITSSEKTAERSGAFDKPVIQFGFGNFDIPGTDGKDTLPIIYGVSMNKSDLNLSEFPFQLANVGRKNAEEVKSVIQYPSLSHIAIVDVMGFTPVAPSITEFKRDGVTQAPFDIVTHYFKEINPGIRMTVLEPFVLRKTAVTVPAYTKDSVLLSVQVQYSNVVSVNVLAKDLPTQRVIFTLACVPDTSADHLIDQFVNRIERKRNRTYNAFVVTPPKTNVVTRGDTVINNYPVSNHSIRLVFIKDPAPDQDMIVAVYNDNNKLEKIRVYNKKNEFLRDMVVGG